MRYTLVFFIVSCLLSTLGWAAEVPPEHTLPPDQMAPAAVISAVSTDKILITATRVPTARDTIANSTTVITAEEIETKQLTNLADALNQVPGMVTVALGQGQQTSLFMRGTNSSHTLVLIDGVEINDPSSPEGAVDFAQIGLEDVARIEIVRGPQSTLYGSDAIGGVIQLTTRRGEKPDARDTGEIAMLQLEGGSDGFLKQQAAVSVGAPGAMLHTEWTHKVADGDSATPGRLRSGVQGEDDGLRNLTGTLSLNMRVSENTQSVLSGRWVNKYTQIDPELDTGFGGTTEDKDAHLNERQQFGRWDIQRRLRTWDSTFAVSHTGYDRDNYNDRAETAETLTRTHFQGEKSKAEWQNDWRPSDQHVATLGLETEQESMRAGGFSDFGGYVANERSKAQTRNNAAYLQYLFQQSGVHGSIGMRVDRHDDFGSELTHRIASVIDTGSGVRIRLVAGTGFKAPTLFQLHGFTPNNNGVYRGNPDLQPEQSYSFEMGLEHNVPGQAWQSGIHAFRSQIKNLTTVVFREELKDLTTVYNSTYVNLNRANINGFEWFIGIQPARRLGLRMDYTYTDARDAQTGEMLLRRPRHKLGLAADWTERKTSVTLGVTQVAAIKDIARVDAATIDGDNYALVRIAARYSIGKSHALFCRVENLLNENHEPADGFQGPNRSVYAGFKTEF